MTTITLEYLDEPTLQFGQYFEHQDAKTGLAEYGPFGINIDGLHPTEIRVGFIGTRETIARAKDWFEECSSPIESQNVKTMKTASNHIDFQQARFDSGSPSADESSERLLRVSKILNRDFVGFNSDSSFRCRFSLNERWERAIQPRDLEGILAIADKAQRIWRLVELFDSYIESIAALSPKPDVIVLALTEGIMAMADAVRISGNFYLNFRRAIKARAMRWDIPLQLLQWRTVVGKDAELQEKTLRAWNFCTAQYYKAEGIPWRPASIARDTCFIGISFYVARDIDGALTMRSSVAQAFDYLGQGLVLRGDPFEWNEETQGPSPHLTQSAARTLMEKTLRAYVRVSGGPPKRIVIHKTSEYWGTGHGQYNERDGFYEGIDEVFRGSEVDLVALRQPGVRLFREGNYPPLRGTYFVVDDTEHYLYTMGFIPYLETYPGLYVPTPWQIVEHHGGTAPKELCREILALTKMNVNNCAFADGTPITLSFSRKIGDIMKHIPEDGVVQPQYKYYM